MDNSNMNNNSNENNQGLNGLLHMQPIDGNSNNLNGVASNNQMVTNNVSGNGSVNGQVSNNLDVNNLNRELKVDMNSVVPSVKEEVNLNNNNLVDGKNINGVMPDNSNMNNNSNENNQGLIGLFHMQPIDGNSNNLNGVVSNNQMGTNNVSGNSSVNGQVSNNLGVNNLNRELKVDMNSVVPSVKEDVNLNNNNLVDGKNINGVMPGNSNMNGIIDNTLNSNSMGAVGTVGSVVNQDTKIGGNSTNNVAGSSSTVGDLSKGVALQGNSSQSSVNDKEDEELLRAFIGNNYQKISTAPFNFSACFFSSFYLLYRKMFLFSLLLYFVNIFVLNFLGTFASLIICVLVGLFFNKFYLSHAHNKVNKIKFNNQGKSTEELKSICASKGGTSIGILIGGTIFQLILAIVIILFLLFFGMASAFVGLFKDIGNGENVLNALIESSLEDIGTSVINGENGIYDGVIISNTDINMRDKFSMVVPNVFEDISASYNYKYEYTSGDGIFNNCSVSLDELSQFSDAKVLIEQMSDYYKDSVFQSAKKTSFNGIDWYSFSKRDVFGEEYNYATVKDGKVYLLVYKIGEDTSNECSSYKDDIVSSVVAK